MPWFLPWSFGLTRAAEYPQKSPTIRLLLIVCVLPALNALIITTQHTVRAHYPGKPKVDTYMLVQKVVYLKITRAFRAGRTQIVVWRRIAALEWCPG